MPQRFRDVIVFLIVALAIAGLYAVLLAKTAPL